MALSGLHIYYYHYVLFALHGSITSTHILLPLRTVLSTWLYHVYTYTTTITYCSLYMPLSCLHIFYYIRYCSLYMALSSLHIYYYHYVLFSLHGSITSTHILLPLRTVLSTWLYHVYTYTTTITYCSLYMDLSRLHIYYYHYVLFSLHGSITSTYILLPLHTVLSTWLYHVYTYTTTITYCSLYMALSRLHIYYYHYILFALHGSITSTHILLPLRTVLSTWLYHVYTYTTTITYCLLYMALSRLHIYYYHYVMFSLHGSITSTHILLPLRTVLSTWLYHVYTYTTTITYCWLCIALSRLHIYYYHYVLFSLHGSITSTHILLPLRTVLSTWLYHVYTYTTTITYCSLYMALSHLHIYYYHYLLFALHGSITSTHILLPLRTVRSTWLYHVYTYTTIITYCSLYMALSRLHIYYYHYVLFALHGSITSTHILLPLRTACYTWLYHVYTYTTTLTYCSLYMDLSRLHIYYYHYVLFSLHDSITSTHKLLPLPTVRSTWPYYVYTYTTTITYCSLYMALSRLHIYYHQYVLFSLHGSITSTHILPPLRTVRSTWLYHVYTYTTTITYCSLYMALSRLHIYYYHYVLFALHGSITSTHILLPLRTVRSTWLYHVYTYTTPITYCSLCMALSRLHIYYYHYVLFALHGSITSTHILLYHYVLFALNGSITSTHILLPLRTIRSSWLYHVYTYTTTITYCSIYMALSRLHIYYYHYVLFALHGSITSTHILLPLRTVRSTWLYHVYTYTTTITYCSLCIALSRLYIYYYHYVLFALHGSITSTHILLPLRTVLSTWLYHVYTYTTTITYCSLYMALLRLHIYNYHYVLFSLHGSITSTHILLPVRTVRSAWLYQVYTYTTTITYCSLCMARSRLHIYYYHYVLFALHGSITSTHILLPLRTVLSTWLYHVYTYTTLPLRTVRSTWLYHVYTYTTTITYCSLFMALSRLHIYYYHYVLIALHGSITSTPILLPLRTVISTWLYHVYTYTTTITYCSLYMALLRLHIYYYHYVLFYRHGSITSTPILLPLRTVLSTWLYHVYTYTTTITYCSLYMALLRLHIYYYHYVLFYRHGSMTSTHLLLPLRTVLSTWLYHVYTYTTTITYCSIYMALSRLHICYYHYVLFALHGSITSTHILLPLRTVLSTWLYYVYTYTTTITYCSLYMALSRVHIYYYHYVLFSLHGSITSTHILLPLRTVLSTWLYHVYTYTTTSTYCSLCMALSGLHIYYYHYVLFALHGSITSTHILLPLRTVRSTWLDHVYTYITTITYCSLCIALSRLHIYYYHYVLFALHGSITSTHILLPLRTVRSTWLDHVYTYTTTITYCSLYMALSRLHIYYYHYVLFALHGSITSTPILLPLRTVRSTWLYHVYTYATTITYCLLYMALSRLHIYYYHYVLFSLPDSITSTHKLLPLRTVRSTWPYHVYTYTTTITYCSLYMALSRLHIYYYHYVLFSLHGSITSTHILLPLPTVRSTCLYHVYTYSTTLGTVLSTWLYQVYTYTTTITYCSLYMALSRLHIYYYHYVLFSLHGSITSTHILLPLRTVRSTCLYHVYTYTTTITYCSLYMALSRLHIYYYHYILFSLHGSITSTHILLPLRTVRSTWLYHDYTYTTTITYCSLYMALSRLHIYYYHYVLFSLHGSITSTHILLPLRTACYTWLYHVYAYTTTIT